ncbi:MAG: hypothetical protein IPK37_05125 [Austwickia sp.]|jgi:hypothetical protein|nr:MAG: hypothetical protein IPK37_05125 [Austwickia sp.]
MSTPGHDPHGPQDRLPGESPYDGPPPAAGYPGGIQDQPYDEPAPRGRWSAFPFPNYTTRTRGGSQVTVGGCCLPLPIGCLTVLAGAAVAAVAAHRRG